MYDEMRTAAALTLVGQVDFTSNNRFDDLGRVVTPINVITMTSGNTSLCKFHFSKWRYLPGCGTRTIVHCVQPSQVTSFGCWQNTLLFCLINAKNGRLVVSVAL